jgi:hypothetical protein
VETLRLLVSIPLMVGEAIWQRLTRDDEEAFIAEQRAKFLRWAEGE